jgi:hypothetical protein
MGVNQLFTPFLFQTILNQPNEKNITISGFDSMSVRYKNYNGAR